MNVQQGLELNCFEHDEYSKSRYIYREISSSRELDIQV